MCAIAQILSLGMGYKERKYNKLQCFHKRCLRAILGISTAQQRMRRISSVQVSQWFGMEESLDDLLSTRQLLWLGHIARMNDECLPKKLIFGWLPQHRPAHEEPS